MITRPSRAHRAPSGVERLTNVAENLAEHKLADLRIVGYSLAGEETAIAVPELNVCFDVGKAPRDLLSIDHVLLSHGHMDHAAGIAYYLSQRNFIGNAPGTIVVPIELEQPVRNLMRAWAELERHQTPANIIGLKPGETHQIRRDLYARSFSVNHGTPSLGYSIIEVRRKLKPEFEGKSGQELAALKKQGVEIQYTLEVPLVAYCGDTTEGRFLELDEVRKARVLIIECTFFAPDHVKRARLGMHMHVNDIARIIPKLENEHVLIGHVTRRTGIRQAKAILKRMVDKSVWDRITFLMDMKRQTRFESEEQQPQAAD